MVKAFFGNVLQNPNAIDSKVTVEFDHIKNGLKIDDEGLIQFPIRPSNLSKSMFFVSWL